MSPIRFLLGAALLLLAGACPKTPADPPPAEAATPVPAFWRNATVYFLLTDRFHNGDPANDFPLGRKPDGGPMRSFHGGDLKGITQKLEEGYFDDLGVNAIWFTPVVEQIHGAVDEGDGLTYAYHGYWARDWTRPDPNFGTEDDLRALVEAAHRRGIRVLLDVVINHTGPVTALDPKWPGEWVRTGPRCTYTGFETTVECTLVDNLPDVLTDRNEPADLPPSLLDKWAAEGRQETELRELDAFFTRTGYPRAPKYYLIKWLTDWVREMGIDGYRFDTAKHIEPEVIAELKKEAAAAFRDWKAANPAQVLDDLDFFLVGEVYGFELKQEDRAYDFGDRKVDYYDHGMESLINFAFKTDARRQPEALFSHYSQVLNEGVLKGVGILNYIASHDDGSPFDGERERPLEAGTKLLLAPGAAQIYYGDETARPLRADGVRGDANLRTPMNWQELAADAPRAGGYTVGQVLEHWRRLGRFRRDHLAVGAGVHRKWQDTPYIFSRVLEEGDQSDRVVVAMDLPAGENQIPVFGVFPAGAELTDYYSGQVVVVGADGAVRLNSPHAIALLAEK